MSPHGRIRPGRRHARRAGLPASVGAVLAPTLALLALAPAISLPGAGAPLLGQRPPDAPADAPEPAAGPDSSAAEGDFSRLTVSVGGGVSSYGSPFDRFWSPAPPLHVAVAAPLMGGRLRAGAYFERGRPAATGAAAPPGFRAVAPYVEWGPAGEVGVVHWSLGLGGGAYGMFADRGENAWELETAVGASAQLGVEVADGWLLALRGYARRVLTSEPLDQPLLTVELGRTLGIPRPLRRALVGERPPTDGLVRASPEGPGTDPAALLPDPLTGRRTIPGDDLRALGVASLADLVGRLPDWHATTVNLRTWWASPKGLSSLDDPGWDVWVDGLPVHAGVMGLTALDRLAVPLSAVDSVVVVSAPGLHDGAFADRGRIHVHTRAPRGRLAVRAEAYTEQPTGDPGPLAHTPVGGANVDRLGTGVWGGAGGSLGPVDASLDVFSGRAYYTDFGASERIFAVRDPELRYPIVDTRAVRASVGLEAAGGRHRLQLARSVRADLPHHPDLAAETPTRGEHSVAGLSGSVAAGGAWAVDYRAGWTVSRLTPGAGAVDFAPDLTVGHREIAATVRGGRGAWSWTAGVAADRREESFETAGDAVSGALRLPASLAWSRQADAADGGADGGGRGGPSAALEIEPALVDGEPALRAALRGGTTVGRLTLASSLHWSRRRPAEEEGLWSLWTRGLSLPDQRGLGPHAAWEGAGPGRSGPPVREALGADLEVRLPLGPAVVRLFADGRSFRGVLLADRAFRIDGPVVPEPVSPTPVAAAAGDVFGAGAEASAVVAGGRARLHAHYRWRAAVSGDDVFRDAWARIPEHRGAARAVLHGPAATSFHARLEAWGGTRWSDLRGPSGAVELPGAAVVDLGADKGFLGGDARVGLWVRDLLDRDVRRHPLGASPGLSVGVYAALAPGW